jgi:type VI secretion system protein ImpE
MTAKDLMKAGRLSEARRVLIEEVKSKPSDVGARTVLFQVLFLLGEWDKALRHLDMISTQDPQRAIGVQAYLNNVKAEQERLKVLQGGQLPSIMPELPKYFPEYLDYLDALKSGKFEDARAKLTHIDQARPAVQGTFNGKPFEGFSDTDARLFAFLETFVHERYVWIPLETVRELIVHEPKNSLDLIWVTASITTWEGLSMNCSMPVIYPETSLAQDDQLKLGRHTEWAPLGSGLSKGVGQHVYAIGDKDVAILEIRSVIFELAGS